MPLYKMHLLAHSMGMHVAAPSNSWGKQQQLIIIFDIWIMGKNCFLIITPNVEIVLKVSGLCYAKNKLTFLKESVIF